MEDLLNRKNKQKQTATQKSIFKLYEETVSIFLQLSTTCSLSALSVQRTELTGRIKMMSLHVYGQIYYIKCHKIIFHVKIKIDLT